MDIDAAALEVAAINRRRLRLTRRVRLIESDHFAALSGASYDIIVSNPPYVGTREMRGLPREYGHEPRLALASGRDGLDSVADHPARGAQVTCGRAGCWWSRSATPSALLARAFPKLPFTWLDFERGGGGVFLLTREQLAKAEESDMSGNSIRQIVHGDHLWREPRAGARLHRRWLPAGARDLREADLQGDVDRRRTGTSQFVSQRKEGDAVRILSGVFEGKTTGTPIGMLIENTDARSRDYEKIKDRFRPGHADYTYQQKYGFRDYRGGGRSSARETVMRVAAGAIARKYLRERLGVQHQRLSEPDRRRSSSSR